MRKAERSKGEYTQCASLSNIIGKANGKVSGSASAAEKKTVLSPPPIIAGKADGKVKVLT